MRVLFILLLFISTNLWASLVPKEWVQAEHTQVKTSNSSRYNYPLVRLKNVGATPVVLFHGIGANAHNWMDIAPVLYRAGFDVWAFGWLANEERNLDDIPKTIEELTDYVYSKTGKKMFVAGHSLGGLAIKLYIQGLFETEEQGFIISDYQKRKASSRILGAIPIAAPNGYFTEGGKWFLPFFAQLPTKPLFFTTDLSRVINSGRLGLDEFLVRAFEINSLSLRLPLFTDFMEAAFNPKYQRFSKYSYGRFFRYGIGTTPRSILDQLSERGEILSTSDGQVSFEDIFFTSQSLVPQSFIAGSNDSIAWGEYVQREAISQNATILILPEAGHMDPILGDLAPYSARHIIQFIETIQNP